MNVLAVDTSSDHGGVVVQIGDTIAASLRPEESIQYSEHLFAAIDAALSTAGVGLGDIDLFAGIRGPGSFTGIRVGLATLDGFAFTTGKPAVGVSALAVLAWQTGTQTGTEDTRLVPMIDARRGEVYCAVYRREGDELIEVAAPAVLQPGELFQTVGDGPLVFCGPGAEAHRTAIEQRSRWRLEPGSGDLARTLARMVTRAHREPLEPLYVRKTSAEIERSRRALTTEDP